MLQSFSPVHDWLSDSELLFDEELYKSLMQSIPTPPQSPPPKADLSKALSRVDQLELVSELLQEDQDFHLNWDFLLAKEQQPDVAIDCLWSGDKCAGDKLSSSPLLSDIDTTIFEEIAGSTLHCHDVALAAQAAGKGEEGDSQEQIESSSDYGSLSAGGDSSSSSASDSEEEIDVVTVRRSSPRSQPRDDCSRREQLRALKRCHLEIQQQHNYAAPCPPSPLRAEAVPTSYCSSSASLHKRGRTESSQRSHYPGRSSRSVAPRPSAEFEDEDERRRTHNVMERQRRNELKNCFMRLRDNVPELSNNDKASKVVILKRARDSIRGLELEGHKLTCKRDKLREKQERLKARLEQLRTL
ncbi:myelocytomatosis oncogene homolog isoform X2 [Denticeps clupeoides]|uniref:BHLH domain-containing protein n=2 Tax=Denticeps clupeoides TaxID=299321 RepID=A0AAY4EX35_9TELE|nr:transcriptional regulator Myc-2-like isoform X2 [Denticeps clupeoides]XP_028854319.1 transcriptional regulator Myc-2-like isoform X2 [Denticeps clupeoides]